MDIRLKYVGEAERQRIQQLELAPGQERLVTPPAESLAMAQAYPEQSAPLAICDGDAPVGYALVFYDPEAQEYSLCHMMIDRARQGQGIGREALSLLLTYIAAEPFGAGRRVTVSCAKTNEAILHLNRAMGFQMTGEQDAEHVGMALELAELKTENIDRVRLPDTALSRVSGGTALSAEHSAKTKTGDSRARLTAAELDPAYIRRQIFGSHWDDLA